MRTIRLYGLAGQTFGREFRLDVASVAEATRALTVLLKKQGFREFIEKHNFRIVLGSTLQSGTKIGEDDLQFRLPAGDIHIVPAPAGAKRGGLLKIIAGVFLLAAAFFVPVVAPGLAATMGVSTVGGLSFVGPLAMAGLGLIVQGVTQMMTKNKKKEEEDDSSFTIDGQLNVTEQGGPVPLIYGRFGVGSTLISGGVTTIEYGSSTNAAPSNSSKRAKGTITFNQRPAVGDVVVINGLPFTFVSNPQNTYLEVFRGANANEAMANLINEIVGSVDSRLKVAGYVRSNNVLSITYKTDGPAGNAYTLSRRGTAGVTERISISGPTLTGGTA